MTFSASDPATFAPVMRTALDRLCTRCRPGHGDSSRLVRSISPSRGADGHAALGRYNLKSIPDRLFDNDRGLAVGPEGRKLFERFLRQGNKLCRSCCNGKRGPSITLSTSHATDSSYLPRCNFAPPASAIQLYAIGRGSVSRCSAGGRGRIASRNW